MDQLAGDGKSSHLSVLDQPIRKRFLCRGTLQGVGFRPAIYRLAQEFQLAGEVCNDADGARIEVEGSRSKVEAFRTRLGTALPPLARLVGIETREISCRNQSGFRVVMSQRAPRRDALIPADAAICPDCRGEIDDPSDRRHRYPFTTCTHCGPRFSIVRALPYDRERTAMHHFPLCVDCEREYLDPRDRRFRTESTCCPLCGPHVWLADREGGELASREGALASAREALAAEAILAVKGLGGFQLACRADREQPISRLRKGKRRYAKPFAVMVRDLEVAGRIAELGVEETRALCSPSAPIVLLAQRANSPLPESVAPGLGDVGLLLPTTPLHVELFRGADFDALVMTSGNAQDEPIARTNEEALARLASFADLFLLHDREVVRRVDDSVLRGAADGVFALRRSRGFVPESIELPEPTPEPVLTLGAHMQTTACLALGRQAFPSQHVGDLDSQPARDFLAEVAGGLEHFLECRARTLVVDLHPDYASSWLGEKWAAERGGRLLRVQHHLAHAAAVLGENDALPAVGEQVMALILDGTGWGPDGLAWGAEWLLIDGALGWQRLAHAQALPLVGGARAVREPWRVAAAALEREGEGDLLHSLPLAAHCAPDALDGVRMLAHEESWPLATGAGRLFEAAGAMLGPSVENSWEGECAARFEALAARCHEPVTTWTEVALRGAGLPSATLLSAMARRVLAGEPRARIARGFHATFCRLAAEESARRRTAETRTLALGGGCLANRLLREGLRREHQRLGIDVLLPHRLPPGDGGISFGQAVLAATGLARGTLPADIPAPLSTRDRAQNAEDEPGRRGSETPQRR